MNKQTLYKIWNQVPVNYYQSGVRKNIFQKLWHTNKINWAKKIMMGRRYTNCLDVGCASGFMISEISKLNAKAKYFGVDSYPKAIQYAQKKYPHINFRTSQADKLPFKDNFFDLIICYETIEHVVRPLKVLQEMKRVLKKDGTLILAMDSGNFLFRIIWFVWENTRGRVWQGAHLHPFHHTELESTIKKAGFKVQKKFFTHFNLEVVFLLRK